MSQKLNVLIVGGTSFLGEEILLQLNSNQNLQVTATCRAPGPDSKMLAFDLCQPEAFGEIIKDRNFDVILWVTAIKDVKWCEANPVEAKLINYESLVSCYKQAQQKSQAPKFIFISSDYVFNGVHGQYDVQSPRTPVTNYGRYKVLAEDFLLQQSQGDCIVRTAALFGKKSVFLNWLISELRQEKTISLFSNSFFTPTSVRYLAKVIEDLILDVNASKAPAVAHICGDQRYSRFAIADVIKKKFADVFVAKLESQENAGYLQHDLSMKASYFGRQGSHTFNHLAEEVVLCLK